jgi:pimeloyl-ACP methyl ester carboxylesterase
VRLLAAPAELGLIGYLLWRMRRHYRGVRAGGPGDVLERLQESFAVVLGRPRLAAVLSYEVAMLYYGLCSWRRPEEGNGTSFSYHREGGYGADVGESWLSEEELGQLGVSGDELAREFRAEFDLRRKLAGYRGALLVLHAEHDRLLDRSHAERLHAWGGGTDKRLVVFAAGNHNSILAANLEEYLEEMKEFLKRAGVVWPPGTGRD